MKGLSGLMSQYAHESDSEETDEDIDMSVYNVEAGKFCSVIELILVCLNANILFLAQFLPDFSTWSGTDAPVCQTMSTSRL